MRAASGDSAARGSSSIFRSIALYRIHGEIVISLESVPQGNLSQELS